MSDDGGSRPAQSAKPPPGPIAHGIAWIIMLALVGLALWGLFALGSCAKQGWDGFRREVAEADALIAAADAREAAEKAAQAGALTDVAVLAGAQRSVKALAVDPGSIQFRNLSVHRQGSGMKAVCGEFNAKTRAGGYNGFERFISAGVVKYTWLERDVADFDSAWGSLCRG